MVSHPTSKNHAGLEAAFLLGLQGVLMCSAPFDRLLEQRKERGRAPSNAGVRNKSPAAGRANLYSSNQIVLKDKSPSAIIG